METDVDFNALKEEVLSNIKEDGSTETIVQKLGLKPEKDIDIASLREAMIYIARDDSMRGILAVLESSKSLACFCWAISILVESASMSASMRD